MASWTARGNAEVGWPRSTTGRGIGPAYEDKVGRRTIRVADLADEAILDTRIGRLLGHYQTRCAPGLACRPSMPPC